MEFSEVFYPRRSYFISIQLPQCATKQPLHIYHISFDIGLGFGNIYIYGNYTFKCNEQTLMRFKLKQVVTIGH